MFLEFLDQVLKSLAFKTIQIIIAMQQHKTDLIVVTNSQPDEATAFGKKNINQSISHQSQAVLENDEEEITNQQKSFLHYRQRHHYISAPISTILEPSTSTPIIQLTTLDQAPA